jgi:hypothetical protein
MVKILKRNAEWCFSRPSSSGLSPPILVEQRYVSHRFFAKTERILQIDYTHNRKVQVLFYDFRRGVACEHHFPK